MTAYNNGTHNYTIISTLIYPASDTIPDGQYIASEGGMNVLGLVVFSIVFGIVLGRMGDKGTPLKAFFDTLNEVIMKMVSLVMWYVILIVISIVINCLVRNTTYCSKPQTLSFEFREAAITSMQAAFLQCQ